MECVRSTLFRRRQSGSLSCYLLGKSIYYGESHLREYFIKAWGVYLGHAKLEKETTELIETHLEYLRVTPARLRRPASHIAAIFTGCAWLSHDGACLELY